MLQEAQLPPWLDNYYLHDAVLGELYRQTGERERATTHLRRALDAATSEAERTLLSKRLAQCAV